MLWNGSGVPEKNYLASWSGGKDGCFACYLALTQGYKISHLVNCVAQEYQRVNFHGTEKRLVQLQGEAIGIPIFQKETTFGNYTEDFKDAIRALMPDGIKGMVFGDIYNDQHLPGFMGSVTTWVSRPSSRSGTRARMKSSTSFSMPASKPLSSAPRRS